MRERDVLDPLRAMHGPRREYRGGPRPSALILPRDGVFVTGGVFLWGVCEYFPMVASVRRCPYAELSRLRLAMPLPSKKRFAGEGLR